MDDTIYRQQVIDIINHELRCGAVIDQCGLETAYDLIEDLPSAQPEIVRCKDCKWYELPSHRITENCVRWMKSNGILLPIKPNDYCSYAERRTDEGSD